MIKRAPEIKLLVSLAIGRVSRKQKAHELRDAFIWSVLLVDELKIAVRPEDKERWAAIEGDAYWRGSRGNFTPAEERELTRWLERSYPQIAQALDIGGSILEVIGQRSLWRELGFVSHEAWYRALDDEAYVQGLVSLVKGNVQ